MTTITVNGPTCRVCTRLATHGVTTDLPGRSTPLTAWYCAEHMPVPGNATVTGITTESEAGPALDARIATLVLGLHIHPEPYSTSMGAAWQVVEWMQAHQWDTVIINEDDAWWSVSFNARKGDTFYEGSTARPSPALAICIAALAAVESMQGAAPS